MIVYLKETQELWQTQDNRVDMSDLSPNSCMEAIISSGDAAIVLTSSFDDCWKLRNVRGIAMDVDMQMFWS